jgi:SLT domain-containing protein
VVALCFAFVFAFAGQSVAQAASGVQAYQAYALDQLGGNTGQSSCLNQLWQRESGWNPSAQNPTSTAYGIPQFLNSTWASTGIAKTSDPYRQIDAGLIYIKNRYGSPCAAWAFWQAHKWY